MVKVPVAAVFHKLRGVSLLPQPAGPEGLAGEREGEEGAEAVGNGD